MNRTILPISNCSLMSEDVSSVRGPNLLKDEDSAFLEGLDVWKEAPTLFELKVGTASKKKTS